MFSDMTCPKAPGSFVLEGSKALQACTTARKLISENNEVLDFDMLGKSKIAFWPEAEAPAAMTTARQNA